MTVNALDDAVAIVLERRRRVEEKLGSSLISMQGDTWALVADVLSGKPTTCPRHGGDGAKCAAVTCQRGLVILLAREVCDLRRDAASPLALFNTQKQGTPA